MTTRLGDHLDFSQRQRLARAGPGGRYPVYGSNGAIGYAAKRNAGGPLIAVGRVGSYCGSVHYCDSTPG